MKSLVKKKAFAVRQVKLFYSRLGKLPPSLLVSFSITAFFLLLLSAHSLPPVKTVSLLIIPTSTPPAPTSIPLPVPRALPVPSVSARYIFILDRDTKTVLYQKDSDVSVPPASTTKMMTALVAMEAFSLDQVITVTQTYSDGQVIGFQVGEKLTVEQLIYALLVDSANDAAEILAANYPGGRDAFVSVMNAKAAELYLLHTHFVNPTGLDEDNHYSSAADLARLADYAMFKPEFARIVGTEATVLPGNRVLTNLNELLGKVPGVLGVKTGFTDEAGQALVTLVNQQNHPVILVVLKSTDRFSDTESLIHWVYSNFSWNH